MGKGALARATGVAAACLALAACGGRASTDGPTTTPTSASATPSASPSVDGKAMPAPGPLTSPPVSPDILVFGKDTLPTSVTSAISKLPGVVATEPFAMGQFFNEEQGVTYAAVDPSTFRRFAQSPVAQATDVWRRVADGEIAIEPALARKLQDSSGYLRLGSAKESPQVHVGAYAVPVQPNPQGISAIDAVVNEKWVKDLHMRPDNALLISTGNAAPQPVEKKVRALVGKSAATTILSVNLDITAPRTAVLTGGSVASAVGSFTYRINGGGTVTPDPAWVAANIRTETLPVVGTVRCHKVMLRQLRQVMLEIQQRGLASKIHDYGGCYVPRYIAGTQTLSFHTFGTAIDLNVSENQRGTVGRMDRSVVQIFEKWGFTWGGHWRWTDPMHFELARLVGTG